MDRVRVTVTMNDWIDVSVPLHNGMVHWPGDPPYKIHRVMDQGKGDMCTVSQVSMGVHTGTHMDAPLHFIKNAPAIDEMPFHATIGPARVIPIYDRKAIGREELERHQIEANERLLFKTANSERLWHTERFNEDFTFIDESGAKYLAERGVLLAGVDYLSVGGFRQDAVETHHALLGAGIWVIEGLNLNGVDPGPYELICLPLKLVDSDGSPARAILRSIL
jgi:arylformamidase